MQEPAGFEYFEHTADVGIRAWGPTLDVAFAQAARGLVAQMVDASQARAVGEARIELEAESLERLLFAFLGEVLDLFYAKLLVLSDVDVRIDAAGQGLPQAGRSPSPLSAPPRPSPTAPLPPARLVATLRGETYDAARHGHVHEIKAMTYHELVVRRDPPEVRVIVDI